MRIALIPACYCLKCGREYGVKVNKETKTVNFIHAFISGLVAQTCDDAEKRFEVPLNQFSTEIV